MAWDDAVRKQAQEKDAKKVQKMWEGVASFTPSSPDLQLTIKENGTPSLGYTTPKVSLPNVAPATKQNPVEWKPSVQTMTAEDLEKEYGDLNGRKAGFGTKVLNTLDNLLSPNYNAIASSAEATANHYMRRAAEKNGITLPETAPSDRSNNVLAAEFGKGEESGNLNRQREVAGELARRISEESYTKATTGDTTTRKAYQNYEKYTAALDALKSYIDPNASSKHPGGLKQFVKDYDLSELTLTGNNQKDIRTLNTELQRLQEEAAASLKASGVDAEHARWWGQEQTAAQTAAARQTAAQEEVNKSGWSAIGANIKSIGAQAASGVEFLNKAIMSIGNNDPTDLENYYPLSTYDMVCTNYANAVREQTAQNIADNTNWDIAGQNMASFLYQTGMSMADNLFLTVTLGPLMGEGAVLATMGSAAASGAMVNALDKGASNWQAIFTGVAQGAAEIITEKIPLDTLPIFSNSTTNIESTRQLLKALWKTGLAEGTEEIESSLMNAVTDALIMGSKADLSLRVQAYMGQGMSQAEAQKRVLGEFIGETMWDGIGGFISGVGMGAPIDLVNLTKNNDNFSYIADTYLKSSAAPQLEIDKGLQADKNSVQYKLAVKAQEQLNQKNSDRKIKSSTFGHLVAENYRQVRDAYNDLVMLDTVAEGQDKTDIHEIISDKTLQSFLNGGWLKTQLGSNAQSIVVDALSKYQGKYSEALATAKTQRLSNAVTAYTDNGISLKIAEARAATINKLIAGEEVSNREIDNLNLKSEKFADIFYKATGVRIDAAKDVYTQARLAQYSVPPVNAAEFADAVERASAQAEEQRLSTSTALAVVPQPGALVPAGEAQTVEAAPESGMMRVDATRNASPREQLESRQRVLEARRQAIQDRGYANLTSDDYQELDSIITEQARLDTEKQQFDQQEKADAEKKAAEEKVAAIKDTAKQFSGRTGYDEKGNTVTFEQFADQYQSEHPEASAEEIRDAFEKNLAAIEKRYQAIHKEMRSSTSAQQDTTVDNINDALERIGSDVRVEMDDKGEIATVDGAHANAQWDKATGRVLFSRDMTVQEMQQWVVAHELTHQAALASKGSLVTDTIDAFRALADKGLFPKRVWGSTWIDFNNWDKTVEDFRKLYNYSNSEQGISDTKEEIAADLMRAAFPKSKLWNSMAQVKPTALYKLSESVNKFLAKLLGGKNARAVINNQNTLEAELQRIANKFDYAIKLTEEQKQTLKDIKADSVSDTEAVDESYVKHSINIATAAYAKEYTGLSESSETAMDSLLRLGQLQQQMGQNIHTDLPQGHWRMNIHNMNEYLAKHKEVWQELLDIQEASRKAGVPVDFVTPIQDSWEIEGKTVEAGLKGYPIEYVTKANGGYKFNGFARTLSQMYIDSMDQTARWKMQDEFIAAVEDAYNKKHTVADPAPELTKMLNAVAGETEIKNIASKTKLYAQTALRSASKTVAALNLNSACPMFTIGNHGCYLDACYLTQMGAGGNTVNLFKSAIYAGEILQLSQEAIDTLNRDPDGLRVNGVGDTVMDNKGALFAALRHAAMRGLKLKIITKQTATLDLLREAARQGIDISKVTVQLSMDNLWIPVSLDDAWGSGIRGTVGIADTVRKGNFDAASVAYADMFGRETKVDENGVMWRKYGFKDSQVKLLQEQYPEITILPRYVVTTASEIAELALGNGALGQGPFIQTLMHGKVPAACHSDYPGNVLNFGALRHVVEKNDNGEWEFYGARVYKDKDTGEVKIARRSSKAHKEVDTYIKEHYSKEQQETIYTNLQKQLCCKASENIDACAGCQSLYGGGCSLCSAVRANKNQNFKPDPGLADTLDLTRGVKHSLSAVDSNGTELSAEQQEFFKDSQIRDKKGNLLVMYHGTMDQFTVFDPQYSDDKISFFFTDKPNVARTYTRGGDRILDPYSYLQADASPEEVVQVANDVLANADTTGWGRSDYRLVSTKEVQKAKSELSAAMPKVMKLVSEFTKTANDKGQEKFFGISAITNLLPRLENGEYATWRKEPIMYRVSNDAEMILRWTASDAFDYVKPLAQELYDAAKDAINANSIVLASDQSNSGVVFEHKQNGNLVFEPEKKVRNDIRIATAGGILPVYLDIRNPFVVNAEGHRWNNIPIPPEMRETAQYSATTSTRAVSAFAKKNGYDGVFFKNIVDLGGLSTQKASRSNIAIAFSSEQIKSIDNRTPTSNPDIRFSLTEEQQKNYDFNQRNTKVGSTLKTLQGSNIARQGSNVGKGVSGQVYFHKNYASEVVPAAVLSKAESILAAKYPGFKYNTMMYEKKTGTVRFDSAENFDTAREPWAGDYVSVNTDAGTARKGNSEAIWHHKWMWVKNDYSGFDVADSWNWSKEWLSTIRPVDEAEHKFNSSFSQKGIANGTGKGPANWNEQLDYFGLPRDTASVKHSFTAPTSEEYDLYFDTLLEELDKRGLSPTQTLTREQAREVSEAVRKRTGVYYGYDGRPRVEIDDSMLSYDNSGKIADWVARRSAALSRYEKEFPELDAVFGEASRELRQYDDPDKFIPWRVQIFSALKGGKDYSELKADMAYDYGKRLRKSGQPENREYFDKVQRVYEAVENYADAYKDIIRLRKETRIPVLRATTLGQILEHDKLYARHPELRDIKVRFSSSISAAGEYDPRTNTITLNDTSIDTLMHEIQHVVQRINDFENGTNVKAAGGKLQYYLNAGEIEARDVENRLRMTEAERRETRPDIDRQTAFNRYGDNISRYSLTVVDPVKSSDESKWTPGHAESWFAENGFPIRADVSQEWLEARKAKGWTEGKKPLSEKGFDRKKVGTQITGTETTYNKIYDALQEKYPDTWRKLRILDASSGMGLGTQAGLEREFNVTDIEPYVHPDSSYSPDYMDYSSLQKKVESGEVEPFDVIISNAVLNVIPQDTRDNMVSWFKSVLADGGTLFVNTLDANYTKGATTERTNPKTGKPNGTVLTGEGYYGPGMVRGNEVFVQGSQSVQKGFSNDELQAYLQDAFGDGYTVLRAKDIPKGQAVDKKLLNAGSGARVLVVKDGLTYAGKNLSEDSSLYDYDFLTKQKPMVVKELPPLSSVKNGDHVSKEKASSLGLENAAKIGKKVSDTVYEVTNTYTGRPIKISKSGLEHGLGGESVNRIRTNARLAAIGGAIVQNAIPINALSVENPQAIGTYAMAALVQSGDRDVVAVITVEQYSDSVDSIESYDVTHAINGRLQKEISKRSSTRETGYGPATSADIMVSIADFLDIVNSTHRSILSDDVLRHFGEERPAEGYYTGRAKFSLSDLGYHAGDLGKAEPLGNMSGDRGTGHFGTGTYFVGDKAQLSGSYAQRPMETVDFSKYNLFRPKNQADGLAVHEFLKGVNSYYDSLNDRIQSEKELDSRIEDFETAVENFNDSEEALSDIDWDGVLHFDRIVGIAEDILGEYEVGQILMHNVPSGTDIWGGTVNEMQDGSGNLYGALNLSKMVENPNRFIYDLEKAMDSWRLRSAVRKFEDFRNSTGKIAKMLGTTEAKLTDAINSIAGEIDAAGYDLRSMYTADSASTRLMKALGYEGVDVRGIEGLDNTMYGSVIYDLKDEDLARKQEIGTAKFSLSSIDQQYYNDILDSFGRQPASSRDVRDVSFPQQTDNATKVMRSPRTISNAAATPENRVDELQKAVIDKKFDYTPESNADQEKQAERWLRGVGDFNVAAAEWLAEVGERRHYSGDMVARGAVLLNAAGNSNASGGLYLQLMDAYAQMLKNAGQTVQAARIYQNMTPSGRLYLIEKQVQKMNEDLHQNPLKRGQLGYEDLNIPEDLIEEYNRATTDQKRNEIIDQMAEAVAQQVKTTNMDRWTAWRYLNMLGNFKTQIRNVIGNAMFQPVRIAKDFVAGALERVSGVDERTTSAKVDKSSYQAALAIADDYMDWIMSGGKYNDKIDRTFAGMVEGKRQIFGKTRFEAWNKTLGTALEKYRTVTDWAMEKGDTLFNKFAFADSVARYMAANSTTWDAADEAMKSRAVNKAIREAAESTYHDSNALSDWVSSLGRGKNTPKAIRVVLEGTLPFRKTPANILMRAYEYSPLSIVENTFDTIKKKRGTSDISATDLINEWAKTLTGTGLVALGYALAAMGKLIGKKPDDEKEAALFEQRGYQAYSFKIGNRTLTLDWLAPESIPLFLGANIQQAALQDGLTLQEGMQAVMAIGDPLLSMSMLQGVNDALENASSYGSDNALVSFVTNAAWGYFSQGATNTMVGQLKRGFNNDRMQTYVDKNDTIAPSVQRAVGKTSAKIPGWNYNQIPYIDAWGNIEQNARTAVGNFFYQLFSPGYLSEVEQSAMLDELQRLYDATEDSSVILDTADKKIGKRDLTAEEYVTYATERGQVAQILVNDLINSGRYKNLSDTEKAKAVKEAYDYATKLAKEAVDPEAYALDKAAKEVQEARDKYNIPEETYLGIAAAVPKLTGNWKDEAGETVENSKSLFIMNAIYENSTGLSKQQIAYLAEALGVNKTVRGWNRNLVKSKVEGLQRRYGKYNKEE